MKNLKRPVISALVLIIAGLTIVSCSKYPTYTVYTEDLDMVWTNYDESADFMKYKTYYVPDTVFIDSTATPEEQEYFQTYYSLILEEVNQNMQERNFVRVDSTQDPDLGLAISIITRTNYVFSYNYWWSYPPYWGYPGYGYYYPWATYMGSYEEGAIVVDMSDLSNIDHTNRRISAMWAAMIGGVLTEKNSLIDQRLIQQIDQAFEQSPYLLTN
jgi:hypothetical protein